MANVAAEDNISIPPKRQSPGSTHGWEERIFAEHFRELVYGDILGHHGLIHNQSVEASQKLAAVRIVGQGRRSVSPEQDQTVQSGACNFLSQPRRSRPLLPSFFFVIA